MTSRISFFKLQKEDMRHRLGIILITVWYFLMEIMALVIQTQNAMSYQGWTEKEVYDVICSNTAPNTLAAILTLCLAVVMAVNGFCYLHSPTKTDLYHALPVKRKQIFWSVFCNALLIFVLLRIAILAVETVIIAVLGYLDGVMFIGILSAAVCYLIIFIGAYLMAVLAMIMTGNTAVGVLGMAVFFTYIPFVLRYIPDLLGGIFFETYVTPTDTLELFHYGSPASLAYELTRMRVNTGWTWAGHQRFFVALLLWDIVLLILCGKLFDRRPSEAAGRSMAFPGANPVIRVLLVVPAAIYTGYFLYNVTLASSLLWMLLGIVVGSAAFHGIIESIYQSDIHGLWSQRKQMLGTLAVSLLIVASFCFDIYGYDSYVPDEDKVETLVMEDNYYNSRSYMFWGEDAGGLSGEEKNAMIKLLQEVIAEKTAADSDGSGVSAVTEAKDAETGRESQEETGSTNVFSVTYRMKNGGKKMRRYAFSAEESDQILELLLQSETYRQSLYSLYTSDWSKITSISWDNALDYQTLKLTEEERQELLSTYLEELNGLTYTDMKETIPTGELVISHGGSKDSSVDDYYYIYPSFEKTLAFLEEKGCDVDQSLQDAMITQIEIDDNQSGETWTVTDTKVIASVVDKLAAFGNYTYDNYYYDNAIKDYSVFVYYKSAYVEGTLYVITDEETLQILMEAAED